MKVKTREVIYILIVCMLALSIPVMLFFVNGCQAERHAKVRQEIVELERKQERLVEQNKKLVGDISIYSNPEEINRKAQELNMHKAESDEIVRVEMAESRK